MRQLHGEDNEELIREIVTEPLPALTDSVLRPLCALSSKAALVLIALGEDEDKDVAQRAKEMLQWSDVTWPEPASLDDTGDGFGGTERLKV